MEGLGRTRALRSTARRWSFRAIESASVLRNSGDWFTRPVCLIATMMRAF